MTWRNASKSETSLLSFLFRNAHFDGRYLRGDDGKRFRIQIHRDGKRCRLQEVKP